MINHARTLLLNVASTRADYTDSGTEGYEFIAPEYTPVKIPESLETIRRVLLGRRPDMLFAGLRAQELMMYVHQSEFAEYARAFDTRITYWPEILTKKTDTRAKKIIINQTYGKPRRLIVNGDVRSNDGVGIAYRSYSVHIGKKPAQDNFFLVAKLLQPPFTEESVPFIVGRGSPVTLPETDLVALASDIELTNIRSGIATEINNIIITENFDGLDELKLEAPAGLNATDLYDIIARWYVIVRAQPTPAIVTAVEPLTRLGEPAFIELFGVAPEEPYKTFKNLWFDHPMAAYRLIGLVLGLIYRTEEIRNGH